MARFNPDFAADLDHLPMRLGECGDALFVRQLFRDAAVPFAGVGHKPFIVDLNGLSTNYTRCHKKLLLNPTWCVGGVWATNIEKNCYLGICFPAMVMLAGRGTFMPLS